jgi:thiamine biosynthesis protein ThiI
MNVNKNIIIHYSEISLKKGNRGFFEAMLKNNIFKALNDLPIGHLKVDFGRFVLSLPEDVSTDLVIERLNTVIGIAHFSLAYNGDSNVDILKEQIYEKLKAVSFNTFRIRTHRADKDFPITSIKVNQIVGERIHTGLSKPVDLDNPDLTCNIEIFNQKVYFYFERFEGKRGLPVGSGGKVVSLLSSGIDSPVASFRMMTRGCKVVFVHFHSFPFTEKTSYYNAVTLAEHLTRFQYHTRLYLVPLSPIQKAIIVNTPAKLRLILYRRAMFRIAELIAKRERAKALITGESLGQVASQTIENITAISDSVSLPILRPLIGMDKETIIQQAKTLGTFNTSIEPYDDCCSYLVPKHPEAKAKSAEVQSAERKIENLEEILHEAIKQSEIKIFQFP